MKESITTMGQKIFILILTIGILGGLVFYMYQISLEFEDSVFTQLQNREAVPPSAVALPTPAPTPPPTPPPTLPPPGGISGGSPSPSPITPGPSSVPPAPASRATLTLVPSSESVKVGDELRVDVFIDTANQDAVAVLASISFDKNLLVGERVDMSGSVFPIESEQGLYPGSARIVRGARSPGYNGSNGLLARMYLRAQAKGAGTIVLEFTEAGSGPSRIILDDGQGTNILKNVVNARYTIL